MLFKHCPQCGSMEFKRTPEGNEQCQSCFFVGNMPEAPIDKINEIRRRSRGNVSKSYLPPTSKTLSSSPGTTPQELEERLKSLKGKSTEDVEFL